MFPSVQRTIEISLLQCIDKVVYVLVVQVVQFSQVPFVEDTNGSHSCSSLRKSLRSQPVLGQSCCMLVSVQQQVFVVTVQKTAEVPHLQFIDKVLTVLVDNFLLVIATTPLIAKQVVASLARHDIHIQEASQARDLGLDVSSSRKPMRRTMAERWAKAGRRTRRCKMKRNSVLQTVTHRQDRSPCTQTRVPVITLHLVSAAIAPQFQELHCECPHPRREHRRREHHRIRHACSTRLRVRRGSFSFPFPEMKQK